VISCWEAKYLFELWRPSTAVRLADQDGTRGTEVQANWPPIIVNPPLPGVSSDAQVSAGRSGDPDSLLRQSAADGANLARIYAGIHFRFAARDARVLLISIRQSLEELDDCELFILGEQ
jgi:hypothetical protein